MDRSPISGRGLNFLDFKKIPNIEVNNTEALSLPKTGQNNPIKTKLSDDSTSLKSNNSLLNSTSFDSYEEDNSLDSSEFKESKNSPNSAGGRIPSGKRPKNSKKQFRKMLRKSIGVSSNSPYDSVS